MGLGTGGERAEFRADGRELKHSSHVRQERMCESLAPVYADIEMQVQGDVLVLYVYQLKKDTNGAENVTVEKVSFRKNGGGPP